MNKSIKSFNIDDGIFRWMQIWQEDSGGWSMSKILEFALLKQIPSRLVKTEKGWEFVPLKTTADLSEEDE